MEMIHDYYNQLSVYERLALDEAFRILMRELYLVQIPLAGDDRCERVIEAIAKGIIESRDCLERKTNG